MRLKHNFLFCEIKQKTQENLGQISTKILNKNKFKEMQYKDNIYIFIIK